MQEAEEQDTCRICSAPAEPDQPLFHPCKCSGTIRYIHQDCLTTWLAHSKKKNCDVCKHPYSFTKVYAPDMPSTLPPVLLVRRLIQQCLLAILFAVRAVAVAIIWLAVLPWVTVWTWRMYFSMGESTAWWISDRQRPSTPESNPFYNRIRFDSTAPPPTTFIGRVAAHPLWLALSADIFTGQIIASLIVLTFVAVFLLREWISQNARPGVFEDEEIPPDDALPAQIQPAAAPQANQDPNRQQQHENFPQDEALARRQLDTIRALQEMRAGERAGVRQNNGQPHVDRPTKKAKGKYAESGQPSRVRRRVDSETSEEEEQGQGEGVLEWRQRGTGRARRHPFARRLQARAASARRQAISSDFTPASTSPPSPSSTATPLTISQDGGDQGKFAFTFKAPAVDDISASRRAASEPHEPPSSTSKPVVIPEDGEEQGKFMFKFKAPQLDDTRRATSEPRPPPFALTSGQGHEPSDRTVTPASTAASSADPLASSASSLAPSIQGKIRRPPLPTTTLGTPTSNSPFVISPARTPLESPSLATYRPPEELGAEAGPSRLAGYFDKGNGSEEEEEELGDEEFEDEEEEDQGKKAEDPTRQPLEALSDSDSGDDYERQHAKYFREVEHEEGKVESLLEENSDPEMTRAEKFHSRAKGKRAGKLLELSDSSSDGIDGSDAESNRAVVGLGELFRDSDDEVFTDEEDDGVFVDEDEGEEGEQLWEGWRRVGEDDEEEEAVGGADGNEIIQAGAVDELREVEDPDAAAALELNEDMDGNVEDDMEGAMEAIGLRGPIYGVLQNAALMIFVLDTAIGLGIWIPFTIGKSTALLSLDPHRFIQILHLPIRAMRLITDPIVDSIAFVVMEFLLPPILRLIESIFRLLFFVELTIIRKMFGNETARRIDHEIKSMFFYGTQFLNSSWSDLLGWNVTVSETPLAANASNSTLSFLDAELPDILKPAEPYFALLGKEVRVNSGKMHSTWTRLALGHGPPERAFAILLGYAVVGLLLSLYMNILTVGNARTAGRAVRSAVRQQLLVLKVAAFIFIELVTFPLGCGIVLDLCTVWLFAEANLQSRAAFFVQAPLTAMFYHWVAGTMFMYSFAVLLSGCRSVMRPGAMWFIKDPQDQNSHPIRDILDRPTLTQLRKICISGVMYSFVVACVVGSVAGLLILGSKSIMPFRWKNREPLSKVPVDLLFLHLVLPYTMRYFRPKKGIKALSTELWKFLAKNLRLTSYFFGGRYFEEEVESKSWTPKFLRSKTADVDQEKVFAGTFRRVPAVDSLALPRDMRATAEVTPLGEPVDDAARELIDAQNAEATKARHNVADDYTVVYMPPYFRYRVICFISLLWIIGAVFLGLSVALPIQLGRSFFKLFTPREVHDGYSLIVGFYLLWACYLIGRAIDRFDKRRQRRGGDGARADLHVLILKRVVLWVAKIAYMMLFLGVVIPILVAFVVELYIVLPIRFALDPALTPTIRVVDTWALGLIYAKIALHANTIQPLNQITRGIQHITANGWTRPDPITATKEVIGPLTGGLIGMILFPGAVFRLAQYLFPTIALDDKFIFMHVYPAIFMFAGLIRSGIVLFDLLSSWSQSIRDKEFLVEMRLRNHEPEKEKVNVMPAPATTGMGIANVPIKAVEQVAGNGAVVEQEEEEDAASEVDEEEEEEEEDINNN